MDDVRESYEMVRKSASEDSEEKTVYGSAPQTLTRRRRAWRRGAVVADDIESKPKVPMSRPLLRPVASTREVLEDMVRALSEFHCAAASHAYCRTARGATRRT